jgi:hypothetical protein
VERGGGSFLVSQSMSSSWRYCCYILWSCSVSGVQFMLLEREGGRDGQLFMRRNIHCVQLQLTTTVDSSKYNGQGVEVRGSCRFIEKTLILELF